ncbi:MAG: gfo/Idh/MocA family oxidoreductase, partial [Candidatus Hydrogenedentes bacterium]|nr:gfo/Idh/MocA family oxidoreductase [Candidatus Hydrogenedentota bacterium]
HGGVTGAHFTEVSCMGMPSKLDYLQPGNNPYKNPFGTEIALFRASGGGMSRMLMSKDTPGYHGERGRVRGDKGSMVGTKFQGTEDVSGIEIAKPPLPPGVPAGGHGGSHGYLSNEFITAILENRQPLVDIAWSLNMTVCGIVAHQSALKDGELMKIPHYSI